MKSIQKSVFAFFLTLLMPFSPAAFASDYDVLIQHLAGSDEADRTVARQLLPREGLRAFPDLLNLLQHDNQRVWRTARNILADICHTVTAPGFEIDRLSAADQLIALLRSDINLHATVEIIRLLGKVAPEGRGLSPLAPYFTPPEFRGETIDALVAMSTHSAVKLLESQLDTGSTQDKVEIIDALRTIGLRADYTVPESLLSRRDSAIQLAAMRALASTGNPALIKPFMNILGKSKGNHETQALDATLHLADSIMQNGGNWDTGLDLYRTLLNDIDSPNAKGAALAGLGRYGDASVVSEIIAVSHEARFRDLEAPALMALDYLRGRESYKALLEAYPNASSEMQLGLLGVMGRKKSHVFLKLLLQNAASEDPSRQALAFEALLQSELPAGVDAVTAYVESRPKDERKFDIEKLLVYADTMRHKNADSAAGKAYLAVYSTTANNEFRAIAFQGIKKYPSPQAYKIILEHTDFDSLSGVPTQTLVALNAMLDPDEFPEEVAALRAAMLGAARSTSDVQSILDMANQQGDASEFVPMMGFITQWYLIGPFRWSSGEGFGANHINAPSLDLKATYGSDGGDLKWKQYTTGQIVNAADIFGKRNNATMYAYVAINSNGAADIQVRVGSDDGVRLWFNGESVHENNVDRGMLLDEDIIPVKLKKGINELLVQVTQRAGGWGFTLRLTRMDGTPIPAGIGN